MTLYDFNRSNHDQRASIINKQGKFLLIRPGGKYSICLYSMDKFFAEVWYRIIDQEIELVRGFNSTACLEPYLNMVDISDINI